MYVLRYLPGVDLRDRFHWCTTGRYSSWVEAEDARQALENADNLEVVQR